MRRGATHPQQAYRGLLMRSASDAMHMTALRKRATQDASMSTPRVDDESGRNRTASHFSVWDEVTQGWRSRRCISSQVAGVKTPEPRRVLQPCHTARRIVQGGTATPAEQLDSNTFTWTLRARMQIVVGAVRNTQFRDRLHEALCGRQHAKHFTQRNAMMCL